MDWLQTLLDNSSTPVWTAFLLGLLTALSPCPLATNIAAIGFIGKDIENRKRIFSERWLFSLSCRVICLILFFNLSLLHI
jgi:cytochrome c-type biogenesis protein